MPSGQKKTELQKLGDEIETRLASLEALRHWSKSRSLDLDEPLNQLIQMIQKYRDDVADTIIKRLKSVPAASTLNSSIKPDAEQRSRNNESTKTRKKRNKKNKNRLTDFDLKKLINLKSKPKRVFCNYKCARCNKDFYRGWQYPAFGVGFKIICQSCKDKLTVNTLPRVDALDRVLPGSFGSGRRR